MGRVTVDGLAGALATAPARRAPERSPEENEEVEEEEEEEEEPVGAPAFHEVVPGELVDAAVRRAAHDALRELRAGTAPLLEQHGNDYHLRPREVLAGGLPNPLRSLSECSDARCGCNRTRCPEVRRNFVEYVVQRCVVELGRGNPLRYTSFGSGRLFQDLEVLQALLDAGFRVACVNLVDPEYRKLRKKALDDVDEEDDEHEKEDEGRHGVREALDAFATWFDGKCGPVRAFPRGDRYAECSRDEPAVYGCDVLMEADAAAATKALHRALPSALRRGGILIRLSNLGGERHGRRKRRGSKAGETDEDEGDGKDKLGSRQFWERMLRTNSSVECHRMSDSDELVRVQVKGENELTPERKARQARARQWLDYDMFSRAQIAGKDVWRVVFSRVAVRATPSTSARIVSCRREGELVATEPGFAAPGWVQLCEEDDGWGVAVEMARSRGADPGTAYMLVDGSPVGLGTLLERENDATAVAAGPPG